MLWNKQIEVVNWTEIIELIVWIEMVKCTWMYLIDRKINIYFPFFELKEKIKLLPLFLWEWV